MSRPTYLALILLVLPAVVPALLLTPRPSRQAPPEWGVVHGEFANLRVRIKGGPRLAVDAQGRFALGPHTQGRRITAWAEGHFIAGARFRGSPFALRLQPLPATDNDAYAWEHPDPDPLHAGRCGNCHGAIHREWAGSAHARSAVGSHFLNLYDGSRSDGTPDVGGWGLLTERPDAAGVCAACHAPTFDAEPGFDLRRAQGVARTGVHCDYCHKITGLGEGDVGFSHGRFLLRLLRPQHGQLFFGPLDDVDRGEDAYSPFYRDSRYCAACHEGVVLGVPVYTTYSEWQASPAARAGQQCQDCHMRPTGRLINIAPGRGGIERNPATLANHTFWDGSQAEMLRRSLRVDVQFSGGRGVRVTLRADGVGHRVPTGFVDRHLILVVEGMGADGRSLVAREGPTLPPMVGPTLQGKPGRLYARLLRDANGQAPAPFWRDQPENEDTRLVPGVADRREWVFAGEVARVRVRVLHRRFWDEVVRRKGWTVNEIGVMDRLVER